MILTALITLLLVGAGVALMARAAVMPRMRAAEQLGDITAYGFPTDAGGENQPSRAPLHGLAARLGTALSNRSNRVDIPELGRLLTGAGLYNSSPQALLGYQAIGAVGAPTLWLWWATSTGASLAFGMLGLVVTALAGWKLPVILVRKRGERRLAQIEHELPELIDLLVVTVEAGLGLSGSIQIAADRLDGPLGQELRLSLQEQRMGLSMNEALTKLRDRCDTPSMRSFARSVVQGEKLGVSIGDIMRNLAGEMRKRRRAMAEERANQAPIKILFPLVFLIFPAMFIVLLYPAIDGLAKGFGG